MGAPISPGSELLRGALRTSVLALAVVAVACSAPKPAPPPSAAPSVPGAVGEDPVEDAHQLWVRVRTNADKATKAPPGDPNQGWLERAIEADGRALFTLLSRPEFEPFAVSRGNIRARLLLVIKPPSVEDRREAIQSVDQEFTDLMKRRGRTVEPRPAPAGDGRASS